MNSDLEKAIEEGIDKAINTHMPAAIEKHVNGHIRELRAELEPVIEGMRTIQNLRRFVLWWGLPPMVLIGGALFMFKMFL